MEDTCRKAFQQALSDAESEETRLWILDTLEEIDQVGIEEMDFRKK
jgi:hypothetical protein